MIFFLNFKIRDSLMKRKLNILLPPLTVRANDSVNINNLIHNRINKMQDHTSLTPIMKKCAAIQDV